MRFNELISGVRSDVAVKVYGDDLDQLLSLGEQVERVLGGIDGAADVKTEQITGLPLLSVMPDRERLARYGVAVADLQRVVRTALGGETAGQLFEGDRRFSIIVRLHDDVRADPDVLARLPVPLPRMTREIAGDADSVGGANGAPEFVPLGELARIEVSIGPNQISRENGKRRAVVTANVRGRDLGSFVSEAQQKVAAEVGLPPGYWVDYGGTFEQLQSAARRLSPCRTPYAAAGSGPALCGLRLGQGYIDRVHRRSTRADWRRIRTASAGNAAVDFCGRGLHCVVRYRCPQRCCDAVVHPTVA